MKKRWIALAALALSLFPLQAQESESTAPRILGIEIDGYYTNNQGFFVENLSVSGCTSLTSLSLGFRDRLRCLDVSGCTALERLDCSGVGVSHGVLTSLDLSGCTALTSLNCSRNVLTSLDVSGLTALTSLNCGGNDLTSLDVSDCINLKELTCGRVDTLKMHGEVMDTLDISDAIIKVMDASECTTLKQL